jgi:hypothetical protein
MILVLVALTAALSAQPSHSPALSTDNPTLDRAFSIALADVQGNIHPYRGGILDAAQPVLMAGAGYDTPWTRDAAINVWNGAGLLWPEVARNTLLSVLDRKKGSVIIGGQYWDSILWTTGAWNYFLYTGDRDFLADAFTATTNTLALRESEEFDGERGLFRGPEVYGDGVAAYPDGYAQTDGSSSILDWPKHNPKQVAGRGYGLPMLTLSTNCAYLHAYELAEQMARVLNRPINPIWSQKREQLRHAIERTFWDADLRRYIAFVDAMGKDDRQEAIGMAFAVLFDIASPEHGESLFQHVVLTPAGIASLWPTYDRYSRLGGFGRHSGGVWPHAQAFWADAAVQSGHPDLFAYELNRLAEKAVRDGQFYELYNPVSGLPDGGLQEREGHGIVSWRSEQHQSWSATGYLRLILLDLVGMHFEESGITFSPTPPDDVHRVALTGIPYRKMRLDISIHGAGRRISQMSVNGNTVSDHRIAADATGRQQIEITLAR